MLQSILRHINRVYDLELDIKIRDFLVSAETCQRLGQDAERASVLVLEGEEGALELGLYLEPEHLERLAEIDLSVTVPAESFEALVTAIEEISHFAYLCFSASRQRRVTQLELELQAEVDKFVTSTLLVASRNGGRVPAGLLDRLFGDFELRRTLDDVSRERYRHASSLASRYCARVVQAGLRSDGLPPLLPELRHFYRMTQTGKIGRIHRVVYAA